MTPEQVNITKFHLLRIIHLVAHQLEHMDTLKSAYGKRETLINMVDGIEDHTTSILSTIEGDGE